MPAFTFRTNAVAGSDEAAAATIAVHCSDARFQPHFHQFLHEGLGLARYGLVSVPGGPQLLTLADYLPKFSWAGWRWMKFLVDLLQARRIILIAHDDCRWYLDGRFLHRHARTADQQIDDLRHVKAELIERFPRLTVETYYARLDGDHAVFEVVP